VWFYALGALLVLATGAGADPLGIGTVVVTLAGGGLVLLALLVGESDNAFADIYSAAVSTQNVAPEVSQRGLSLAVGASAFGIALAFSIERYEVFLFLIGSVFVPLAAVFLAEYFVRRRGRFAQGEPFAAPGWRLWAFVPWVAGFVVYHWSAPTGPQGWVDAVRSVFEGVGLPFPLLESRLGASLPSFAAAFALTLVLPRRATRSPHA
jgi:purine-cytosine permease-like protein